MERSRMTRDWQIVFRSIRMWLPVAGMILMGITATLHAQSMLPKGMVIETEFRRGAGPIVGKATYISGNVVVVHSGENRGYRASKGISIHKGDTVVTMDRSRARLRLDDGSIMTMGAASRLKINRSLYNPKTKTRSSFIDMGVGKARFLVKKLLGFKKSEFKVKTQTAVLGVRGSDFIVRATKKRTTVTALKDTLLELWSLADPSRAPALLADYERSVVDKGKLPTKPVPVPVQELEQMINELVGGRGQRPGTAAGTVTGGTTIRDRETAEPAAETGETTEVETVTETEVRETETEPEVDEYEDTVDTDLETEEAEFADEDDVTAETTEDVYQDVDTDLPVEDEMDTGMVETGEDVVVPEPPEFEDVVENIDEVAQDLSEEIQDQVEPERLPDLPGPPTD